MSEEDVDKCAHNVEGEMFSFFGDTGHHYKNKYRSLMFNLKDPRNKVRQTLSIFLNCYVMFKKREGVFYWVCGFRPYKTSAASFLNGFKNIPGKACVNRVHNNNAFVNYQQIKHRILIRRRFIDINSLHVTYYRPFDRSMGF